MYKFLLFILPFLFHTQAAFSQLKTEKALTLTVSLVKNLRYPAVVPEKPNQDSDLKLVLLNNTDSNATFYRTWNTYGDNAIRLELRIKDSVFRLFYSSYCDTRNFPAAQTLKPGDSMVVYIKVEECFQKGPCPCLYSLPNIYRFPKDHLLGAQLRAFYQVNLENHQQAVDHEIEIIKIMDLKRRKKRKVMKEKMKYLNSFVISELKSEAITISTESW